MLDIPSKHRTYTKEEYDRLAENVNKYRRSRSIDWEEIKNRRELNLFLQGFLGGIYPSAKQTNFITDEFNLDLETTHYEKYESGNVYKVTRGQHIYQIKKGNEYITREVSVVSVKGKKARVIRDSKNGRFLKWTK